MSIVASIRFNDILPLALSSLRHNRLRSGLTIGAVAVGIGVMVYLVSLGFGMEKLTLGEVAKSNALLSITVRSPVEKLPLDDKAVAKIGAIDGVKQVLPKLSIRGQLKLNNQTAATTIVGADVEYLALSDNTKQVVGNYYRDLDEQSIVVTTGFLKLFGLDQEKVPLIPFTMEIDKEDFPGLPEFPNNVVRGVVQADAAVAYIPRKYLEKLLRTKSDQKLDGVSPLLSESAKANLVNNGLPNYEDIKVKVKSLEQIESVQQELIKNGFRVETVAETMSEIRKVFFWIRVILGALGLIAIVVASIGMFNTLTISLLERTKEIGIMKALGVKKGDISRIFLTEAFMMGFLGGLAGILLAIIGQQVTLFILSLLASLTPKGNVPELFLNYWYIILGSLFFAIFVAMVTGFYPARRATRLNPIEAIKYE